jgi:hypothetical protein
MAVAPSHGTAREAAEAAGTALARAALVHRFDPLELIPAGAGPVVEARALALVARDATETDWPDPTAPGQVRTLWRLTLEARRRELRKLVEEGKLDAALKEAGADKTDMFAWHLKRALSGEMNPASVAPDERESAAAAALFAAEVIDPSRAEKMRDAVRELRTDLSEAAAEQRASGLLRGELVGRSAEQAALEAFAAAGAVRRSDRLPIPDIHAIEIAAYLLEGPSGSGKSTLVADMVRRWRGYSRRVPLPSSWTDMSEVVGWAMALAQSYGGRALSGSRRLMNQVMGRADAGHIVVLDLGRLALAIGGEIEWTGEVTRQIGLGTPALASRLSRLRDEVGANRMLLDPSGKYVTAMVAASADLKQGLAAALEAELPTGPALVLVLDDFEEAVARSFPVGEAGIDETMFGRVLNWADSFATATTTRGAPLFSAVRVIAAGSQSPALDDARLARWFVARMEIRPLGEIQISRTRETPPGAELPAPGEARARDLSRRVGPLRLHADEVARLPAAQREAALLSRMELARQQGRPVSLHPETAENLTPDPAPGPADHEIAAEIGKSPDELFAFLREPKIGTQIDTAFTFGDFATAAAIGWRRIGTISEFPDLSEPWRLPGDPVSHWIWQTALAALAIEDASAARSRLEDFLGKFARCLDPARARTDATGLVLAAAATVALDGRLPPEVAAATQALAEKAASLVGVRTFTDLRLLALHPVWRDRHVVTARKVQIPYRRLRLFSASLLAEPHPALRIEGLDRLVAFVADARIEAPAARDIDTFACSDGKTLELFIAPGQDFQWRVADILVGLSPELYDTTVIALIEADRTAGAAIDLAITATRARAPFWPRDLVPESIPRRDRDRRAGAIARVVLHADRCGLLQGLLESVTERIVTERLRDVTRLVQRYEALRRRAFAGIDPRRN